ncbi:disulfide bond formation protein B [Aurantiacibacter aquimixticola]|uniref:Disulfide bond formation protein B n=1 Tax=Aurantiacibacter aquimixticola TaxID=1958945 RepID=A0A419RUY7_9SPHN|nr:disulfide bond formation protein B [Aurantiacibacter aquimixticola]RJY09607.1 disulfide bond formation protein B [Aurantiacibacter aquimixticola]
MTRSLSASDRFARQLAFAVPALLLAGAYVGQYGFGLYPCEMCWWQRWPHFAAIAFAFLGTFAPPKRFWIAIAAGGILTSGLIGAFHAGVEYGWWQGITGCASGEVDLMSFDVVRCDEAAWSFIGISLAGWNALLSIGGAVAIWVLLAAKERVK